MAQPHPRELPHDQRERFPSNDFARGCTRSGADAGGRDQLDLPDAAGESGSHPLESAVTAASGSAASRPGRPPVHRPLT